MTYTWSSAANVDTVINTKIWSSSIVESSTPLEGQVISHAVMQSCKIYINSTTKKDFKFIVSAKYSL